MLYHHAIDEAAPGVHTLAAAIGLLEGATGEMPLAQIALERIRKQHRNVDAWWRDGVSGSRRDRGREEQCALTAMSVNMLAQLADALFSVHALLDLLYTHHRLTRRALAEAHTIADAHQAAEAALRLLEQGRPTSRRAPGGWPNPLRK
jgi:hypothetical protein